MTAVVRYERADHVAVITLDRPAQRNAVSPELALELEEAVDRMEADNEIRAGVLSANTEGQSSPVFCAGADLKAIAAGRHSELFTSRGYFGGFVFRERTKPIVGALDGLAVAGGVEILLACDIVVATTRSSLALLEVTRNLVAGAGALFRLPRAVGRATALDLLLTAEPIGAARAYELGMISRLVEPGRATDEACALAARIAANAPIAVRLTRELVLASEQHDDEEIKRRTAGAIAEVYASEDAKEGLAAFAERRSPDWRGR